MIQPEPNWAADLSGLQPGEAAVNIPLPAAGRLGVIEEKCNTPHADEKRAGLNLLRAVGGWVCPNCGATV